jgi:hypothetical protein
MLSYILAIFRILMLLCQIINAIPDRFDVRVGTVALLVVYYHSAFCLRLSAALCCLGWISINRGKPYCNAFYMFCYPLSAQLEPPKVIEGIELVAWSKSFFNSAHSAADTVSP